MTRLKFLPFLLFTFACTAETPSNIDSAASTMPAPSTKAPAAAAETSATSTNPSSWKVSMRGIGPIVAGMTVEEANNTSVGNQLVIPANLENECGFASLPSVPDVLFMIEKGIISRVDVTRASNITTEAGAKIGDTEAQIKSLYPGVETQPHKYTDGHYLVVTPSATSDQAYRLVFETDGQKVLRYRSGRMPAVQYVEGCS